MEDVQKTIDTLDFRAIAHQMVPTPESNMLVSVAEWERVSKYITYLQEVEAYHDKVMDVLSDMPIDIDDIIEASEE